MSDEEDKQLAYTRIRTPPLVEDDGSVWRMGELIRTMPDLQGYKIRTLLQGLRLSQQIFNVNARDLLVVLETITQSEEALELYLFRRDEFVQALMAVPRLLHNFVSSSMSLVDHTRRLYQQEYEKGGKFPEYQQRIDRDFKDDPLSQFVQGLRNYVVHKGNPPLTFNLNLQFADGGKAKSEDRTIGIGKAALEEYRQWNEVSRRYFDVAEFVDVQEACKNYTKKVVMFHEWFHSRMEQIHSTDFQELRRCEEEFRNVRITSNCITVGMNNNPDAVNEHSLFFELLASAQLDTLCESDENRVARAELAIALLGRSYPVPEDIKKTLRDIYRNPAFRLNTSGPNRPPGGCCE